VKIFVTGPPASGKTFYSEMINAYYNIPRVSAKELSDQAFSLSKTEEEEGLGAEIKAKLDEMKDAAVAKIEEERADKDYGDEEPPEIDRDSLPIRVPDDIIYKLMIVRLSENDCRNRGYILDGFPRSYEDCQNIFLKKEKKFDEEGNEIEEEEPELEEG
jgi:adenylate kinase